MIRHERDRKKITVTRQLTCKAIDLQQKEDQKTLTRYKK